MKKIRILDISPEARQAMKERKLQGSWQYPDLIELLTELTHWRAVYVDADRRANRVMILCVTAGILFAVLAPLGSFRLPVGICGCLGAVIAGIVLGRRPSNLGLHDDFQTSLIPALHDLRQDIAPDQKIKVRLDLSGREGPNGQVDKPLPSAGRYSITESSYSNAWCEVRLPLVDGSTAVLEFHSEWIRREKSRSRPYSRRKGRVKTKISWRTVCAVTASLIPDGDRQWNEHALRERTDENREKAQVLQRHGRSVGRLDRWWKLEGKDSPPAREVVGMLLRLYAAMEP